LIRCTSLYWLVRDRYSTFLSLGVSSPWLLLAVSVTRYFPLLAITQRFLYSTYPVKGITCIFTQTFHYLTFQLLDVSALPMIHQIQLQYYFFSFFLSLFSSGCLLYVFAMIELFKIVSDIYDKNTVPDLSPAMSSVTRGHNKKLFKPYSNKNVVRNFSLFVQLRSEILSHMKLLMLLLSTRSKID